MTEPNTASPPVSANVRPITEMKETNKRNGLTPARVAVIALAAPWALWFLCLVTDVFVFGPLGFIALVPCGVVVFVFTTRNRLALAPAAQYPGKWIAARIVAGLYAVPFIPFALFVLLRGLE